MACSKFEYVKNFESQDQMLPNCYVVVRIDGKGFHKFTASHNFEKPNDKRGLDIMNKAAQKTMEMFQDIFVAYGQSDEYSFVFHKNTKLFKRRSDKILSTVVSCFTSNYVFYFSDFFPNQKLQAPPVFDSRCVLYPSDQNIRDYMSWRQADCHINNLYNTCFWLLVNEKGMGNMEAQQLLKDTDSGGKNEILFNEFGINYNSLPEQYRKGNTLIRSKAPQPPKESEKEKEEEEEKQNEKQKDANNDSEDKISNINSNNDDDKKKQEKKVKMMAIIEILYCDIIRNDFWKQYEKNLGVKLY